MKRVLILASLLASTSVFANDVDPNGFEKQHFSSSMSREEFLANAAVAKPAVSIRIDDQGRAITAPSVKSRAQVAAETAEASRLGLVRYGEVAPIDPTAEQEQQIKVAGQRAAGHAAGIE